MKGPSIYRLAYTPSQCLAYLQRLDLGTDPTTDQPYTPTQLPPPTLTTLTNIHTAHLLHVPFTSLKLHVDPLALPPADSPISLLSGTRSSTNHETLFNLLVTSVSGGCCFENNVALAALLRGLGFRVVVKLARANFSARGANPRDDPEWSGPSHCVLFVRIPGDTGAELQRYIVDVGFGAGGLIEPLPLRDGASAVHALDPETRFDLVRGIMPSTLVSESDDDEEQGWTIYKTAPGTAGKRLPIIRILDATVHYPHDLEIQNAYVSREKEYSYLVQTLVCFRIRRDGAQKVLRVAQPNGSDLVQGEYYVNFPGFNGGTREEERKVQTVGDLEKVLREEFGIRTAWKDAGPADM